MTESLQEIERLVNQCGAAIDSYIGEGSECDILMAAITRVVQRSVVLEKALRDARKACDYQYDGEIIEILDAALSTAER